MQWQTSGFSIKQPTIWSPGINNLSEKNETSELPHLVPEAKKFITALWLTHILPQGTLAALAGKQSQNVH